MDHQLRRIAELHLDSGRPEAAIEVCRQILGQDPDDAETHTLLARALLTMKRLPAARLEIGLALQLAPMDLHIVYVASRVMAISRDFDEAERLVKTLQELDPMNPWAWEASAFVAEIRGDRSTRKQHLEHARSLDPDSAYLLADLSEVARLDGDLATARTLADEALQIEATQPEALLALGYVLLETGDTEGARDLAIEVLRGAPSDVAALTLLTHVKARESWFLGLWWRFHTWVMRVGVKRAVVVLLGLYLVYRFGTQLMEDLGNPDAASLVQLVWFGACLYTWVGPGWFMQALKKELKPVELSDEF